MVVMPRFSIAALLWLTAIVAIAAALPRSYNETVYADGHIERVDLPIADEIAIRAIVVVILCCLVLLGIGSVAQSRRLSLSLGAVVWSAVRHCRDRRVADNRYFEPLTPGEAWFGCHMLDRFRST
jgi:hypothetical protein